MEQQGWVKSYREWFEHPYIAKDSEYYFVWMYLLHNASFSEVNCIFEGRKTTLKKGQLLTSRGKISKLLNISDSKVKRILECFKNDQLIDQRSDRQQSLITIRDWELYQCESDQRNDQRMTNDRPTEQETENEKEKRSKREKDKEKEKNKNERMKEYIHPSLSPLGETGREDFSLPSGKALFSSDKENVYIPKTEEELDRWLCEDDGIDEWDKVQIYYRNLNSRQQLAGSSQQDSHTEDDEADSFALTNPIQQEKKEIYIPQPQTPSPFAKRGDTPPSPVTVFEEFWKAYPKKVGKGYAQECFKKIRVSRSLLDTMLEAIAKQKKSDMWKRDKGQYIPNPSTWLNQKRWEDDLDGETEEKPRLRLGTYL